MPHLSMWGRKCATDSQVHANLLSMVINTTLWRVNKCKSGNDCVLHWLSCTRSSFAPELAQYVCAWKYTKKKSQIRLGYLCYWIDESHSDVVRYYSNIERVFHLLLLFHSKRKSFFALKKKFISQWGKICWKLSIFK